MESETALSQPWFDNWFPYTKLQPPQLGGSYIIRERLQQAVAMAVMEHKRRPHCRSGRIRQDGVVRFAGPRRFTHRLGSSGQDRQRHLRLFASLLATALRPWLADGGRSLITFLQSVPNLLEKTAPLAARLINDLVPVENGPLLLILDDFHAINDTGQFTNF